MTQSVRTPDYPIHPQFTQRWSARAFQDAALSQDALFTILEAARWAPSAYNHQPWNFVYALKDTSAWAHIFNTLVPFNQSWAQRASAFVVLVSAKNAKAADTAPSEPNPWHAFDSGAAWYSLALQASLSGWAAHATAGFDAARLREAIALPEDYAIQTLIAIGRPGDAGLLPEALQQREHPNARRALSASVHHGRFGD